MITPIKEEKVEGKYAESELINCHMQGKKKEKNSPQFPDSETLCGTVGLHWPESSFQGYDALKFTNWP